MEKSFSEIEKDIDSTLHSLPIFHFPLNQALTYCLTAFELAMFERTGNMTFTSYEASARHFKASLQTLVPELYKNCPVPIRVEYNPDSTKALNLAQQAIDFCTRYSSFEHAFTLYHYGWYQGSIDNNTIIFSYPEDLDFGLGQLNMRLHLYRQEKARQQAEESGLYPPSVPPTRVIRRLNEIIQSGSRDILHSIPDEVRTACQEIAKAIFPKPTIDRTTQISSYTLEEYYNFWLEFATLMLVQHSFNLERSRKEDLNQVIKDSILIFNIDEITNLINDRLGLASNVVNDMAREMILNINVKRPDILIQPLLPLQQDKVLIAPSLIFTANWELCLFRNWIQRYRDLYSRIVAQKKVSLADEIGRLFESRRFIVATNRKLKNTQGTMVGDVDVAVFDPNDGGLALFEVKWILEADSARETKSAEDQIFKGITQIKANKTRFDSDPQGFLKNVFSQRRIDASDINYVIIAVIGYGDIGGHESQNQGVPVFDYELTREVINDMEISNLESIINSISEKHNVFTEEITKLERKIIIPAAGYLLCLPGWGDKKNNHSIESGQTSKIFRASPCPCGSGRKYKDCCKRLEKYSDNAL